MVNPEGKKGIKGSVPPIGVHGLDADAERWLPVEYLDGGLVSAVKFIDENGVAYGIKHVDNKLRVSAMPYTYDIAEGNMADHASFRILGYNTGLPNGTLEDITTTSANVNVPVSAVGMEVVGGAQDNGIAIYTSTATGGTATTLVDTAQNFLAAPVVVAGDVIFLDDVTEFGIVTGVAAQTLTCADGFSGDVIPANGDNYRVIDVSGGGTGIQAVEVHGLDGNY